ncbi:MAG: hypothetical protein E6P95_02110, partial [Candidatus Moraniibacteriota bacterium]
MNIDLEVGAFTTQEKKERFREAVRGWVLDEEMRCIFSSVVRQLEDWRYGYPFFFLERKNRALLY